MAFTSTTLLASAAELLAGSGYRPLSAELASHWQSSNSRLFEDPYSLVAVVAYDTWRELFERWPDAQASLVEMMSMRLAKAEPKSWDAYLVLLTPAFADAPGAREMHAIRYDTTRVRKLIATGEELQTLEDVQRTILPLLPVLAASVERPRDVLDLLIDALANRGVDRDDASRLVSAYTSNQPLITALYRGPGAV